MQGSSNKKNLPTRNENPIVIATKIIHNHHVSRHKPAICFISLLSSCSRCNTWDSLLACHLSMTGWKTIPLAFQAILTGSGFEYFGRAQSIVNLVAPLGGDSQSVSKVRKVLRLFFVIQVNRDQGNLVRLLFQPLRDRPRQLLHVNRTLELGIARMQPLRH